ncbi:MAG: hypothetical protein JST92_07055 [Deltaproteobacteria bacterium]|nr:hypothetical protein [Deltaproteobacteria bacterium]
MTRCALFGAALLAAACGGTSDQPDTFNGALDGTVLDAKFLPNTAKTYPVQQGYANGKPFYFYNLGAQRTSTLPTPIPVTVADHQANGNGGQHADFFPNSCTPGRAFNARTDSYPTDKQAAVFDSLPLATTAFNAVVWPVVAQYGVTGVVGETCNDIKDSRSIANPGADEPGSYGATRTATPSSYQLWPIIDPTVDVPALTGAIDPTFGPRLGWYKGLYLKYLDGGRIPTALVQDPAFPNDPSKQIKVLLPMEGVILDPAGSSSFALPTDAKAVLAPAVPGDDAYSPILRLHDFRLPTGKKLGDYTGICTVKPCAANLVDITLAGNAFNTIFIVSAPQQ